MSYSSLMRTTLILEDSIYQRAKVTAAERGVTVASVIEEALHLLLASESRQPSSSLGPMPVDASMSWKRPGVDINDSRALLEIMDSDEGPDVLR
jgi:hypothetical protein